jgi:hypothetical protein
MDDNRIFYPGDGNTVSFNTDTGAMTATSASFGDGTLYITVDGNPWTPGDPEIGRSGVARCRYCLSEFHDSAFHPGTCCNCGAPK